MRSFKFIHIAIGLFLAAVSIFAAPVRNFEARSLSSEIFADDVFERNTPPKISFGSNVPEDHHASITTAIHDYHASLPANHPTASAPRAHVIGGGWHKSESDAREHTTVRFFNKDNTQTRNHVETVHLTKP